jgi:hypothetical protein
MNPTSSESPGLQLPPPVGEQVPTLSAAGVGEADGVSPERIPTAAEFAPAVAHAAPATTPTVPMPLPPMPAPPVMAQSGVSATTQTTGPTTVDDGDLIEKEWVTKAKQIVERTRDNPYQQSEELTLFKADYMKKRYDKTIKVSK